MRIIILIYLFMQQSLCQDNLVIGFSKSNIGPVKTNDIKKLLECTSGMQEEAIPFTAYPTLRGMKEVERLNSAIDAFFPVYNINQKNILAPFYIDEVLLISYYSYDFSSSLSVGTTRGDFMRIAKEYPLFKMDYLVNSSKALFKGLEKKRTHSIIVYRSQIPHWVNLDSYYIKTLFFQDVGIKINQNFISKSSKSYLELKEAFLSCIVSYSFSVPEHKKADLVSKLEGDIKKLQNQLLMERINISNVKEKERLWSGSPDIRAKVLGGKQSVTLRNVLSDYSYINEAFTYNHQGGVLASLKETSDFDQSDEDKYLIIKNEKKFTKKNISHIYYDESTKTFQVGISIRLTNSLGEFTGGLYIGADINKLFTYYKVN